MQQTIKVYVQHVSFETLHEAGWEIGDGGREAEQNYLIGQKEIVLNCLTHRQQKVAQLLTDGFSRKEIAEQLNVCLQAIHQIVLRMRRRLQRKAVIWKK